MLNNPFIPQTVSYLFFEQVQEHQETPKLAKTLFNRCGQRIGGAELANHILKRDRWLYMNATNPEQVLNLNAKIQVRPRSEIDKAQMRLQMANTARWKAMRAKTLGEVSQARARLNRFEAHMQEKAKF